MADKKDVRCIEALIFVAITLGCGQSSKTVQTPPPRAEKTEDAGNTSGLAGLDASCKTSQACRPIAADISASFSADGRLVGMAGQPVNWEFHGVDRNTANPDQDSSSRRVMVLLDKVPDGSVIMPSPSTTSVLTTVAKLAWTPQHASDGKIDVIVRDFDRCILNESQDRCNKYAFLKAYDTKFQDIPWVVIDQAEIDAANQKPASTPVGTAPGINAAQASPPCQKPAGIPGVNVGTLIQGAINPTTIVPTLFSGFIGTLGQPKPAGC